MNEITVFGYIVPLVICMTTLWVMAKIADKLPANVKAIPLNNQNQHLILLILASLCPVVNVGLALIILFGAQVKQPVKQTSEPAESISKTTS